MSFRKYRNKRRRSQAFPREDIDAHLAQHARTEDVEMAPPDEHLESEPQEADSDVVTQPSAKEQEVWDTFREENYEALEQLPLSLHRSYALIQELDEQVTKPVTPAGTRLVTAVLTREEQASDHMPYKRIHERNVPSHSLLVQIAHIGSRTSTVTS
ncbi:hypothetical protein EW026_g3246 [Hermanssonia centrifuga]|uniref:Uncharacterized protein n=1 Tax=Hermanssonia centrifuga TaxID=98765 RepID=A0A4S4KLW6_9APHY|nr:hypothetical protein EW026_g3246 [Hermanssonia centrifuga]